VTNRRSAKPTRNPAVILTAVTVGLALLATGSILVAIAWYHDDQCLIAEWQCSLGALGLFGFMVLGPLAALSALLTALVWAVELLHRDGR
jgi:hypothetical protein